MTLANGMLCLHITDERASLMNGKYDVSTTKRTLFHTSVSDVTAEVFRHNNNGYRDPVRKSDIVSTSSAASASSAKRSYLHWSVSDCSSNPKHYLLCPRGSVKITPSSRHGTLLIADPLGYDGLLMTSLSAPPIIKHATSSPSDKAISNLKYARFSEGIVLARRRPNTGSDVWLTSSSQPKPGSQLQAADNCGGERRYKSSAHIDLFTHSPAVYSVACYTQSCRCSLCYDKLSSTVETLIARHPTSNTWHRQRIDAIPVSFSLCTIWNFQYQDDLKAKKKRSAPPRATTTTLTRLSSQPFQLTNDSMADGTNVGVAVGGSIARNIGNGTAEKQSNEHRLSTDNSDNNQKSNQNNAANELKHKVSNTPEDKNASKQKTSSKSNGALNGSVANGHSRVLETDL